MTSETHLATDRDGPGHRPVRPSWRCSTDGQAWPCVPAQGALRELFADDDGQALVTHLSWLMGVAADDLGIPDPTRLYRRFVRWALAPDEVCRVCGRGGHTVLPGVPPRLTPWHEQHAQALGGESGGVA